MAGEFHKINLQTKNSVAQIEVLKQELAEVTAALTENSKLNSELKVQNEVIKFTSAELLIQAEDKFQEAKTVLSNAEEVLLNAKVREQESIKAALTSSEKVSAYEARCVELTQNHARIVQDNELKIGQFNKQMKDSSTSLELMKSSIVEAKLTLDDIRGNIRQSGSEFASCVQKQQTELGSIQKQIEEAKFHLGSILEEIESEREKIQVPMNALIAEGASIDQKRADIFIYETRVRDQYRLMFPDRAMPL